MKKRTWLTILLLGAMVIGLVALLIREAARGPVFRAEEYNSVEECIRNIPTQWPRGSLDYMSAEAACGFVHARPRQRPGG